MNRETAVTLAAAAGRVTEGDVNLILNTFLVSVAHCSVCDNARTITFHRETSVAQCKVEAGTRIACPNCGAASDTEKAIAGDPEFFGWHCFRGDSVLTCQSRREDDNAAHVMCGDRVLLPLPPPVAKP
jgi:hypothetical protein